MSKMKLYGGYSRAAKKSGAAVAGEKKKKRKRTAVDRIISVLLVLVALEGLYCTAAFSDLGFIKKYREMWIQTAMSTMRHQWLATAFLPSCVIDEVMAKVERAQQAQVGVNTQWTEEDQKPEETEPTVATPEDEFYELFWELDRSSMERYIKENPDTLSGGWGKISINEAGLDDDGTSIQTTMGEQVLAIDAANKTLVVRVSGSGYRGALVIAKDPAQLSIYPAKNLGSVGENAGSIAERHNGIVAMTASGFIDDGGNGNGGTLAGYAMMNGEARGQHMYSGYHKRLELHEDNHFYITDIGNAVNAETTDAVEFTPALIVDGKVLVDENNDWNGLNPRACIGQSEKGEILMLAIEGRLASSLGTGVAECAKILKSHDCMQAMNLDGGTSAILWYDGEYIIRCSNQALPAGRTLPNAFVYEKLAN